jgi:hypothetical protein
VLTGVRLALRDGTTEFIPGTHVHGVRDDMLLIATGTPGAGLDAEVLRAVPLAQVEAAETCEQDEDSGAANPDWVLRWPNA